jgi:hypothetical protein
MAAHPQEFYSDLIDDRLLAVAEKLIAVREDVFRILQDKLDCNYTRETVCFGRSRNMLIKTCQAKEFNWLTLAHAGMDVTINIGDVPCRFFRDDAEHPEKLGFFRRNSVDGLFAEDDKKPVMWRFVVEKAISSEGEDRVLFAGYNVYQEKVAEWQYRQSMPGLHTVGDDSPASKTLLPAPIEIIDEASDAATGTD